MIKILDIGNSFSEDATKFLHQTAKGSGIDTKVVNLYIGGCPLEKHWANIENNKAAYQYQINGVLTERKVSVEEVLQEEEWDYIVTQQVSHDSGWKESYEPFLGLILDYLKKMAPKAEVLLQETWAYEIDSKHANFMRYHRNQTEMHRKLKECYESMAEKYSLRLIPCGDVLQKVREQVPFRVEKGGLSLSRDGFHMSFIYGRYLLACVWVKTLFGVSVAENTYVPKSDAWNDTGDIEIVKRIRQLVEEFCR